MAKGHKKIAGSYCYKGNGCMSRFCEFCCNGDKYEEIKIEDEEIEDEEIEDGLGSIVDKYRDPMTENAEYASYTKKLVDLYEKEIGNKAKDIETLDTCLDLIDVFIKVYFCRKGGCEKCPLVHYTEPDNLTACAFDDFVCAIVDLEKYLEEKENE